MANAEPPADSDEDRSDDESAAAVAAQQAAAEAATEAAEAAEEAVAEAARAQVEAEAAARRAAIEALYSSAEDVDDDGGVGRGELLRLLVDAPAAAWADFAGTWGERVLEEVMEDAKLNQDDFMDFAEPEVIEPKVDGKYVAKVKAGLAKANANWERFHAKVTSHGAKQLYAVLLVPLVLAWCAALLALELGRSVITRTFTLLCCCCSCGMGAPNGIPLPPNTDEDELLGTVKRVVGAPIERSLGGWSVVEPTSPAARGVGPEAPPISPETILRADGRADRILRAPLHGGEDVVTRPIGGRTFFGDVLGEVFLALGGWAGALVWQTNHTGSSVHMANVGAAVVGCHDAISVEAIFDPTLTTRDDEGTGRLGLGVRDFLSRYFYVGARSRLGTNPIFPLLPCKPPSGVPSLSRYRRPAVSEADAAQLEIERMEKEAEEAAKSGLPPAVVRMMHKRVERARVQKQADDKAALAAPDEAALAADPDAPPPVIPPPSHDAVREFFVALLPDVAADVSDDTRHTAACDIMAEVMNEWIKIEDAPAKPEAGADWKVVMDPRQEWAPVSWPALHSIRKQHRTFTAPTKRIQLLPQLGGKVFFIGGWQHTVHYRPWWQIWFWRHGMLHRSRLERGVAIAARCYVMSLYLGVTWKQIKKSPVWQKIVDSGGRRYGKTDSWRPQDHQMPIPPRYWVDHLRRANETIEDMATAVRATPGWPEIALAAAANKMNESDAIELVLGAISASHSTQCFASPMLNAMLVLDRMIKRDEMDGGERIGRLKDEDDLVSRRGKGNLLDSFVWELARHNGSYVGAKVKRDMSVRDSVGKLYRVRRATTLLSNTALASRDPNIWHEPEQFMPARFVASVSAPGLSQPSRGWKKSGAFTPAGEQKQRPERWARSAMTEPLPTLGMGCALGKLRELDPEPEPTTPRSVSDVPEGEEELTEQDGLELEDRVKGGGSDPEDAAEDQEEEDDEEYDEEYDDESVGSPLMGSPLFPMSPPQVASPENEADDITHTHGNIAATIGVDGLVSVDRVSNSALAEYTAAEEAVAELQAKLDKLAADKLAHAKEMEKKAGQKKKKKKKQQKQKKKDAAAEQDVAELHAAELKAMIDTVEADLAKQKAALAKLPKVVKPKEKASPQFALSSFASAGARWQTALAAKAAAVPDAQPEPVVTSSRSSSSHRSPMLHLHHATIKWWVNRLLTIEEWHPDGKETAWSVGGTGWPSRHRWWQRLRCPRKWQARPSALGDCCRGGAYYVEPIDSDDFDLHPSILRWRDTVFPVTPKGFFRLHEFGKPEPEPDPNADPETGDDLDGWAAKDGAL